MAGKPTNRIDYDDPKANMYGCLPCPNCGSRFRFPYHSGKPGDTNVIRCDDCQSEERLEGEL